MSEVISPRPDEEFRPRVSPYNLDDFPAYKETLLRRHADDAKARERVEQTFALANPEDAATLMSEEYSAVTDAEESRQEFDSLYPALDEVYALDLETQRQEAEAAVEKDGRTKLLKAAESAHERYRDKPNYYLKHWQRQAQSSDNPTYRAVCLENDRVLDNLTKRVLRPNATLTDASEWYLKLGSLSVMAGSEEMLVYAASLPARRESAMSSGISVEDQKLNAACMFAEAARVNEESAEPDRARQTDYEARAMELFREVAGTGDYETVTKAKVFANGIKFRRAGLKQLDARRAADLGLAESAMKDARAVQDELGSMIEEAMARQSSAGDRAARSEMAGPITEMASVWMARRFYMSRKLIDRVEFRQAFPREDCPHDSLAYKKLPREAFDSEIVIRNIDKDGNAVMGPDGKPQFIRAPFQVKTSDTQHDKVYHPSIRMMRGRGTKNEDDFLRAIKSYNHRVAGSQVKVDEIADNFGRSVDTKLRQR